MIDNRDEAATKHATSVPYGVFEALEHEQSVRSSESSSR